MKAFTTFGREIRSFLSVKCLAVVCLAFRVSHVLLSRVACTGIW